MKQPKMLGGTVLPIFLGFLLNSAQKKNSKVSSK